MSLALSSPVTRPHAWPSEDTVFEVVGEKFEVNFDHVYRNSKKLFPARLGYKVRHKAQFKGLRDPSPIWQYGVELYYLEDNINAAKLWLCKKCHLNREFNDAKVISGNRHVVDHLKAIHRIDPYTGLMPETPSTPSFASPFEAARVAGSGTVISHSPWQEEALQSAVIDWLIIKDVSFQNVASSEFRGLLTWNRSSLLHALPNSHNTVSQYVVNTAEQRMDEVGKLLRAATSKINLSVDVWTSSNYLSFPGVVAHLIGKSAFCLLPVLFQPLIG